MAIKNLEFPDTDLRVTSSRFQIKPTLRVKNENVKKLESLFDTLESQPKRHPKEKKHVPVETKTGSLFISGFRAYTLTKKDMPPLLPSLRQLEDEYKIDVLKDKLVKARKRYSSYQDYQWYKSQLPKLKEEADYIFGELQAQKIQLNNIKENKDKWIKRTKRIIKHKWDVFNEKKNEAYANINQQYKKMKMKYQRYRREQADFDQARRNWQKPRGRREWAQFWNKMSNNQNKTPEYYEGCWENGYS
jgi:hypothetical protein